MAVRNLADIRANKKVLRGHFSLARVFRVSLVVNTSIVILHNNCFKISCENGCYMSWLNRVSKRCPYYDYQKRFGHLLLLLKI